ncbi:hypothetical protein NL676_022444 [Syzygium grande]|nr:hypothetical protein NL676_022444 [Syzygium grande]
MWLVASASTLWLWALLVAVASASWLWALLIVVDSRSLPLTPTHHLCLVAVGSARRRGLCHMAVGSASSSPPRGRRLCLLPSALPP